MRQFCTMSILAAGCIINIIHSNAKTNFISLHEFCSASCLMKMKAVYWWQLP